MLGDHILDVRLGLKKLVYKSLIQISTNGNIVMHRLLQQVAREAIQRQDPGKRQILIDTNEICDVLENDYGGRSVIGISFDISTLRNDMYKSATAYKRIRNLQFLSIYKKLFDANVRVHVPEDMDFPHQLRLLDWTVYPGNCLPRTFRPAYLVEINLTDNKLEKLWEGIQPLKNLKKINLARSSNLKELPSLSNATNLKRLNVGGCQSLVEIPSSIENLHQLEDMDIDLCINLQVVPTLFNLASLKKVYMTGCWQLIKIPDIPTNIIELRIADSMLEDLVGSIRLWCRLQVLSIFGSIKPYPNPLLAEVYLKRRGANIHRIPDSIKDLHGLKMIGISGCPKLTSLPEFPRSLRKLIVRNCESLETLIHFPFPIEELYFPNCFKLGQEARRVITQQSRGKAWLPGRIIPAEFGHRAIGNLLTIPLVTDEFKICLVVSPKHPMLERASLWCRQWKNDNLICEQQLMDFLVEAEHLFKSHFKWDKLDSEILLEFICTSQDIDIIECGLQILTNQTDERKSSNGSYESRSEQVCDRRKLFDEARSEQV